MTSSIVTTDRRLYECEIEKEYTVSNVRKGPEIRIKFCESWSKYLLPSYSISLIEQYGLLEQGTNLNDGVNVTIYDKGNEFQQKRPFKRKIKNKLK